MLNKLKLWKTSRVSPALEQRIKDVQNHPIPGHVAIIMDGNGRWAKKRALPRVAGHHEGMQIVKKMTKLANRLGVETLTLYAFSTENWKRPKLEVDYLMKLPEEFLSSFLPELVQENVKVTMMGERGNLPETTMRAIDQALESTKDNTGLNLNLALNYGSRGEIIDACKKMFEDIKDGKLDENEMDDEVFSTYLMSSAFPDPDLLIRTSGEIRLSNFMLWQIAYTELWFTDVLWPDFKDEHLLEAIEAFQRRSRRYGGIHSGETEK